ncbi:endonuclease domain-containing protein [Brevundimonas sp. C43]|uniref:endonuclease domain-containing protein n=1 Tax=Brevundimonas sp. C43 TaxID=3068314 RepID=UPI003532566C
MRAPVLTQKRARSLRRSMSLPEVLIWQRIRGHGFRRQHTLGVFILDFYRTKDRLCIEIDGQQHDLARDARRDAWLADKDVRTIRIPATAVLNDPDAVADLILSL